MKMEEKDTIRIQLRKKCHVLDLLVCIDTAPIAAHF